MPSVVKDIVIANFAGETDALETSLKAKGGVTHARLINTRLNSDDNLISVPGYIDQTQSFIRDLTILNDTTVRTCRQIYYPRISGDAHPDGVGSDYIVWADNNGHLFIGILQMTVPGTTADKFLFASFLTAAPSIWAANTAYIIGDYITIPASAVPPGIITKDLTVGSLYQAGDVCKVLTKLLTTPNTNYSWGTYNETLVDGTPVDSTIIEGVTLSPALTHIFTLPVWAGSTTYALGQVVLGPSFGSPAVTGQVPYVAAAQGSSSSDSQPDTLNMFGFNVSITTGALPIRPPVVQEYQGGTKIPQQWNLPYPNFRHEWDPGVNYPPGFMIKTTNGQYVSTAGAVAYSGASTGPDYYASQLEYLYGLGNNISSSSPFVFSGDTVSDGVSGLLWRLVQTVGIWNTTWRAASPVNDGDVHYYNGLLYRANCTGAQMTTAGDISNNPFWLHESQLTITEGAITWNRVSVHYYYADGHSYQAAAAANNVYGEYVGGFCYSIGDCIIEPSTGSFYRLLNSTQGTFGNRYINQRPTHYTVYDITAPMPLTKPAGFAKNDTFITVSPTGWVSTVTWVKYGSATAWQVSSPAVTPDSFGGYLEATTAGTSASTLTFNPKNGDAGGTTYSDNNVVWTKVATLAPIRNIIVAKKGITDGTNGTVFRSTTSNVLAPIPSTGITPQAMIVFENRLWIADNVTNRLHYSAFGSLSMDPNDGAGYIGYSEWIAFDDKVQDFAIYNGRLIVFLTKNILVFSGRNPVAISEGGDMQIQQIIKGVGMIDHGAFVHLGNHGEEGDQILFIDSDGVKSLGVIVTTGDLRSNDISMGRKIDLMADIKNYLAGATGAAGTFISTAMSMDTYSLMFKIPCIGYSVVWCYDYLRSAWYRWVQDYREYQTPIYRPDHMSDVWIGGQNRIYKYGNGMYGECMNTGNTALEYVKYDMDTLISWIDFGSIICPKMIEVDSPSTYRHTPTVTLGFDYSGTPVFSKQFVADHDKIGQELSAGFTMVSRVKDKVIPHGRGRKMNVGIKTNFPIAAGVTPLKIQKIRIRALLSAR